MRLIRVSSRGSSSTKFNLNRLDKEVQTQRPQFTTIIRVYTNKSILSSFHKDKMWSDKFSTVKPTNAYSLNFHKNVTEHYLQIKIYLSKLKLIAFFGFVFFHWLNNK